MATTKKTTAKKTATKAEAPVEAVVEAKVEATAVEENTEAPAKKTTAKKTTTKSTATKTTTAKKTTTRKTTKKAVEPTVDFYVEFNGVQEQYATIIENVKKVFLAENEGAEITSVTVYLKPQENAAYCVINGENEFRMDVYF
ncbi:MAG: hypothetical protein II233_05615 [Clostridia bacterium]|nr:hypothetical protein [Clostridia bacterium]MEE1124982.1 DUF6465 family protein [Acutalibacteraceae bacterium]